MNEARRPTIQLLPDEMALLSKIMVRAEDLPHDHHVVIQNGEFVRELTNSLLRRQAIPAQRIKYFVDPTHNPGGHGKSRLNVFEHNGTRGDDIFRHPHFLNHLRYFLFGPELPAPVIASFSASVADCGVVSSGDIDPLRKEARQLVRSFGLQAYGASD